jgi:hypothetical protein
VVLPRDVEQTLLHAMVEPRAAEDELAEPVDERLFLHERHVLPVAHEVEAEPAARLDDPPVRDQLDEIGLLVVVEVVRPDQAEPDRGRSHALAEVLGAELEAVPQELDDEVVSGAVVRGEHAIHDI